MKRELKLRKLAKPLKEARKDARIDKAVLFVEDLFGRKRESSPDILIINDKNRDEVLKVIREDFPSLKLCMSPIGFLDLETIKELVPDANMVIGINDLFKPIKTYKKYEELAELHSKGAILCQIAGKDKPTWRERIRYGSIEGIQLDEENLVMVQETGIPLVLVHELIHAEDDKIIDKKNPIYKIIIEGRAVFAEEFFRQKEINDEDFDSSENLRVASLKSIPNMIKALVYYFPKSLRENGLVNTVKIIADNMDWVISRTSITDQKWYVPFAIAVSELAHILKDPYAAFRITTEKQPRTRKDIKNVREFYREEIEEYQRLN